MRPEAESLEGSQRPCGVMPAWPFCFFYCLTVKTWTLGERPLLADFVAEVADEDSGQRRCSRCGGLPSAAPEADNASDAPLLRGTYAKHCCAVGGGRTNSLASRLRF